MVYAVAFLYSYAIIFHSCFSRSISKRSVSLTLFYVIISVVKSLIFITIFPFSKRFPRKFPIYIGFCLIYVKFSDFRLYFKKYMRQHYMNHRKSFMSIRCRNFVKLFNCSRNFIEILSNCTEILVEVLSNRSIVVEIRRVVVEFFVELSNCCRIDDESLSKSSRIVLELSNCYRNFVELFSS